MKIKFLVFDFAKQVLRSGVIRHFLNENSKNKNEFYNSNKIYGGYNTNNIHERFYNKNEISFFAIYFFSHIDIYEVKYIKNIKTFYYRTTFKNNDDCTEVLKKKLEKKIYLM